MAFCKNLATFKIVNNQSFQLCLQTLPLGTNSLIFKVTFSTMCHRNLCIFAIILPNNATDLEILNGKSSKRRQKLGQRGTVWKFQDFSVTQILREILNNLEVLKQPFMPSC